MVKKLNSLALEYTKKLDGKLTVLSPSIISEAISYIKRNNLNNKHQVCCKSCLKAHLIKKAKVSKLTHDLDLLENLLPGEIGHDGYYLDQEDLFKV